jgi:PAS domain S-box-containing protein
MLISVVIFFWGVVEFLFHQAATFEHAYLWLRIGLPWSVLTALFLHFSLAFANARKFLERKWAYVVIYGPAVFFIGLNFFTDAFKYIPSQKSWGWDFSVESTPMFYAANIWVFVCGIVSLSALVLHHRSIVENAQRTRSKYVVGAMLVAVPILFLTEVFFPYLQVDFPRLMMPTFALVSVLIGYGIWKHKLFGLSSAAATVSIINTMSDALFLVGMDKKIKLANEAAQRILEFAPGELDGEPIDIVFAPKGGSDDTLFKQGTGFRGLIKTVIKGDVEAVFVSKTGKRVPVSISGSLIRDTDNDLLGIVCIARDISERKRVQESLHLSEQRYQLIVENAPFGIISIDTDGNIVDVNPKLIEILGSPSADSTREINVLTFGSLVEAGISADFEKCLEKSCQLVAEHPYTSKWGRNLFLRYYLVSRCNSMGEVVGVQGIVEDITEAKQNAEELQRAKDELEVRVKERTAELSEANRKLKQEIEEREEAQRLLAAERDQLDVTLRFIADAVIAVDSDANIVLCNRIAESLTGVSAADAAGKPLDSVFTLVDSAENPAKTAMDTGSVVDRPKPVKLRGRDGAERLIAHSASPIRDSTGKVNGAVLVFADITEKHNLEEELFRVRKLESIGILASGIAHDFNNILTGIITNLFVAKMQIDKDSEACALMTETEKAAFKASTLTNQLLAFSKEGAPVKIVASMREIVQDSVGFFLSGSNVDYRLEFDDDLWNVEIDRGQIDQVLQSIIRNADEAMPDGGTILISINNLDLAAKSTLPLAAGKYVSVTIYDEGPGVAQEDLERFFDPYFSHQHKGTGLGLAAAYAIVSKHKGHISVSSQLGTGTTVSIFLPACERVSEGAGDDENEEGQEGPSDVRGKILLMDDEEIVRKSGSKLMVALGYDVSTCSNGEEAVRMFEQARNDDEPFDVVILDLTVPGAMGAKETIRKLRQIDPGAKGIVSSGYSADGALSNYRDFGFSAAIKKPYSIDDLKDILQKTIEQR